MCLTNFLLGSGATSTTFSVGEIVCSTLDVSKVQVGRLHETYVLIPFMDHQITRSTREGEALRAASVPPSAYNGHNTRLQVRRRPQTFTY